jgi:hypothetical protein
MPGESSGRGWWTYLLRMSDTAEMHVLCPRRAVVAVSIVSVILIAFLSFTLWLAIGNLLHPHGLRWIALACSATWVLIVTGVFAGLCYDAGGVRQQFIRMLGALSSRQFVRIELSASGEPVLCLGYSIVGKNFYYRKVRLDGITGVSWNAGQGSHRVGKDLDDWNVAVWYESAAAQTKLSPWHRDREELDIVGMDGPKESIEQLGRSLVDFLCAAGIELVPDVEGNKKFIRSPRV